MFNAGYSAGRALDTWHRFWEWYEDTEFSFGALFLTICWIAIGVWYFWG